MISCSLHQILTLPFECCIISNFLLSSFGVGSVSCSQLKGVTSGVFCCCSPSAQRFNVLCVHRCSSTSLTFFKILMLVWTSAMSTCVRLLPLWFVHEIFALTSSWKGVPNEAADEHIVCYDVMTNRFLTCCWLTASFGFLHRERRLINENNEVQD